MFELVFVFFLGPLEGQPRLVDGEELKQVEFVFEDYQFRTLTGCMVASKIAFNTNNVKDHYFELSIDSTIEGVQRMCRTI